MTGSTIRDVARVAGVSVGTVSNFLNGNKRLADPTRERIEAAISTLEFVPNTAVRVLHGGRSNAIALIVADGMNPYYIEVARGIEDVAYELGHVVITCSTDEDPDRENRYAQVLSEARIRGAIIAAPSASASALQKFRSTAVDIVILGDDPAVDRNLDAISFDDFEGGCLAMEHIIELGHRSVVFVGGPGGGAGIEARYDGGREVWRRYGLPPEDLHRLDSATPSPSDRMAVANDALDRYPSATALVCANDLIAIAAQSAALRRGIAIPDQLAIVGFDDIEAALTAPVPLTTVHQPQRSIGAQAARMVLGVEPRTGERRTASFPARLVVRASTVGFS